MLRKNFPDSEIAKSYHCARTKIACNLNYALANGLNDAMKKQSYSLSIDASNDSEVLFHRSFKIYIYIYIYIYICLPSGVDAAKSSDIFKKIDVILPRCDVSWDNYTSFGVDNTKSCIGAMMKFVKPLVMQLPRDSNIPHADTQNQVEDCKCYIGLAASLVIRKKRTGDPFNFLDSFCLLHSEGLLKKR